MEEREAGQAMLATLEDVLVGEFRAYQTLVGLTKQERRLLSTGDLNGLAALIAQKETLLVELNRLEKTRTTAMKEWARQTAAANGAGPSVNGHNSTLAEMLPKLDPAVAKRLGRLREGILALVEQARNLTHGNCALANAALERVEAVRSFLLHISEPAVHYHAFGEALLEPSQPVLAVEHWA